MTSADSYAVAVGPDIQAAILFLPATSRGRDLVSEHTLRDHSPFLKWPRLLVLWYTKKGFGVPLPRESIAMSSFVEQQYQSRMDSLSPKERVARCAAMLKWARGLIARQVIDELGEMSAERLKWEVARRMYGADSAARAIIDRKLADVSG